MFPKLPALFRLKISLVNVISMVWPNGSSFDAAYVFLMHS